MNVTLSKLNSSTYSSGNLGTPSGTEVASSSSFRIMSYRKLSCAVFVLVLASMRMNAGSYCLSSSSDTSGTDVGSSESGVSREGLSGSSSPESEADDVGMPAWHRKSNSRTQQILYSAARL